MKTEFEPDNFVPLTTNNTIDMKAVICSKYGTPEVLQIAEVEKPIPKNSELLVKIKATTVTVADIRVRSFTIPIAFWVPARFILGILKPKKPILGVELSGEIEITGRDVRKFKKGDKIFAAALKQFGAYAEYICLPESGAVALMPQNATYEEAAAVPIGARTALHYLKKAEIKPGQKILIYGASGSVGTYTAQLAKFFGAEVTCICSGSNFEMIESLGVDRVIDYTNENWTHNLEMYDIIFVAVDKFSFSISNRYLKNEGIFINISKPVKSFSMFWTSLTSKKKIFVGESSPETAESLNFLKGLVESGKLKPIIDRKYTLDEIIEAHRYVDKGHKKGNVVITIK